MNKKLIFSLLLVISLSSCQRSIANIFPERPDDNFKFDDEVSPDFRQGWKDGCETGMKSGSNTFYQMFYSNNAADGYKMTASSDYSTAWNQAFVYCYRYDYIKQKDSRIWGSIFGGYR